MTLCPRRRAGSAWMGLDLGTKTIGVAVSDRLLSCCNPSAHHTAGESSPKMPKLSYRSLRTEKSARVILGLPRNMDGSEGPRCQSTRAFAPQSRANLTDLPIGYWDERLSTVAAERALLEADTSRKRRAEVIDHRRGRLYLTGRSRSCATYSGGAMKAQNIDDLWKRDEIDSPCIKLCSIHPGERICIGCYRSIEEIGGWSQLSPEQRREIMADLPQRAPRVQKRRGGRASRLPNLG